VQHESHVGDAVARRVELPVGRSDQLSIGIDLEFQPAAGFLGQLLSPCHRPLVEGVVGRDEVRELELECLRLRGACGEYQCGGQRADLDGLIDCHSFLPSCSFSGIIPSWLLLEKVL
jgi:hypothetical protein